MTQTDRQTDKATHWKSAIFDVDDNWAKLEVLPDFVKEVHRQKEICPTTGNPHFQCHVVCHRQVRINQLSGWIKATKWLPVLGKTHIENSIKYTSKPESAVEGTHQVIQGEKYWQFHEILQEIAKQYSCEDDNVFLPKDYFFRRGWIHLTSRLVDKDPKWVNKLSNPALKKAWDYWGDIFLYKVREYVEETSGAYIIEGPASEEPVSEECLIE